MKQKNNLFKIILLLILTAGGVSAFNWSDGSTNEYLPPDSEIASGQHVKARHMQSYKNALEDLHERAWRKTGSYSFYNGGNVGIGTATPSAKLDVEGGAIEPAKGNGLDWTDNPYGGSGDDAWIKYIQDGSSDDTELQIGIADDGTDNIAFYQSGSERMTIYNGKVGINKTNPSRTLDVAGDINFTGSLYQNGVAYAGVTSLDDLSDAQHDTHNNLFLGQAGFSGATYYNDYNTAVGIGAFDNPNTDNGSRYYGDENTAIGYNSLTNNTTGYSNTAVGFESLYSNTAGRNNSAFGFKSLYSNTTGQYSSAIGYNALRNNTSGSNNTALGYYALYANETGTLNTAVGNNALSANKASFNTAVGYFSLKSNTTGNSNIAIGVNTLEDNTTGSSNIAGGRYALRRNTTGYKNIAIGQSSLYENTSGFTNIAIGDQTLNKNTTGYSNIGGGYKALYFNQTGIYNIGIGDLALYNNYGGSYNVAIGPHALENNNTDSGYNSGDNNVAIGNYALSENTLGGYNVALGANAGNWSVNNLIGNREGNYSVFLGHNSASKNYNDTNQIVIGANAEGNGSNTVTLGADSITDTYLKGDVHLNGDLYDKNGDLFMGSGSGGVRLGESYSGAIPENQTRTNTCSGPTGTLTIPTSQLYQVTADVFSYRYTGDYNNLAISLLNSDAESVFLKRASILHGSGGYMFIDGSELVYLNAGTYTISVTGSNANTCGTSSINKIFYGRITATKVIGGGTGKFVNGDDTNDAVYNAGNVGIGTTSPSAKLDIISSSERPANIETTNSSNITILSLKHPNTDWEFHIDGSKHAELGIYDHSASTMRWNALDFNPSSGYLGLGTNGDTSYRLSVNGNIKVNNILTDGADWSVGGSGENLEFREPEDGNKVWGYIQDDNGLHMTGAPNIYANGDIDAGDDVYLYDDLRFKRNTAWFVVGGNTRMYIRSNGYIGIGTTSPSYKLHVNGTAYATGAAGALSDKRHKKNIKTITNGLETILKMRPVSFDWKEDQIADKGMEGKQLGFIAQEIEKVLPEIVLTEDNDEKTKSLKYTEFIPVVVKAVQELKEEKDLEIKEQKERLDRQEKEIQELREMIEGLKR